MAEDSRFCKNCKQDVAAANFSLHEAHCLRFLALCPDCDKPVAHKDMADHQAEAHKQVRCKLCHQSMQQYQLEHHETEECLKRAVRCRICELELPFDKLKEHLDTCASRTEHCGACNKYITYRDQSKHREVCPNTDLSYQEDVNFQTREASTKATFIYPTGTGGNLCHKCNKAFPDEQYPQHLKKCNAAQKPTEDFEDQATSKLSRDPPNPPPSSLAPSSSSKNAMVWKDVRPKTKQRDQPMTSKTLLKPPENKEIGFPSPTSPQALADIQSFDMLETCAHCNILLPLPTLQKHEIKCLRLTSLKMLG
ncbi:XIAP-associated factor 1 [Indicator indicator]|uniref:XIAP-associated factor 1 n=1 Tax=Indicator indicator TaxID=1002788 RepID=UPI0023DFB0EC|nr:XIAP-associated factor 1 [Indicator indicator]